MNRWPALLLFVLIGLLAGCQGERIGTFMESVTPEGRWRPNGTLIRGYDVSLPDAYNAAQQVADQEGWTVSDTGRSVYEGHLTALNNQGDVIEIKIWAPRGRATEIGVEYNDDNRMGSARVLDMIEQFIPGARLRANQA